MAQIAINDVLKERMQEVIDECMGETPPFCVAACPLHVDVKGYIGKIAEGKPKEALAIIRETLPFPGILGRICAHPCEEKCKRGDEKQPLSVAGLKRFAANYDDEKDWDISIEEERSQHVVIIGSGPAGAMAAYELRKKGYKVTIFEALPVVGGMLRVGIPAYRLPRDIIDYEYSILTKMGVEIKLNTCIGTDIEMSQLINQYDAVFVSVGAHKSITMDIPGIDLQGVLQGVDFLRNVSLGQHVKLGKKVAVLGGGDVAMDAARTAIRLGAEEVKICYRRSRTEMPARLEEIEQAEEEGVKFQFLVNPVEIQGEKNGQVKSMTCLRYELGEPDDSGRRKPIPIKGSEFEIEVDNVIITIGQTVENRFLKNHPELLNSNGKVACDKLTLQTSIPKVFAGGDAIGRNLIAIEALAQGKKAAISIDKYLNNQDLTIEREKEGTYETNLIREIKDDEKGTVRTKMNRIPIEKRISSFDEVEIGFIEKEAVEEARRCLQCECKQCMHECFMLNDFCDSPKKLIEKIISTKDIDPLIAYSCNMCDQCTIKCPKDFKFSEIFGDIRKELVKVQAGPLPQHKPIHMHQYLGFHSIFNIVKPDINAGFTKRVFVPGCALPSYNPDLVGDILKYLQEKLPGTGAILKCCGKPTKAMGMEKEFKERYQQLEKAFEELGAEEVIVACQSCYNTISKMSPHRKILSLYEVLSEIGIPKEAINIGRGRVLAIHDSCVTRDVPIIHESVRHLLKEMGYEIEELANNRENARCCGFGGMVVPANPELAKKVMKRRAQEAKAEIMVTYCAACRESMTLGGKKSLHLMDLMFNRDWEKRGIPGIHGSLANWINRYKAKQRIKNVHKK